jgi:hypothetical protein
MDMIAPKNAPYTIKKGTIGFLIDNERVRFTTDDNCVITALRHDTRWTLIPLPTWNGF